jgi:oligopeptidase A
LSGTSKVATGWCDDRVKKSVLPTHNDPHWTGRPIESPRAPAELPVTAGAGAATDYESLLDTEEALDAMMRRLTEILGGPVLTQDMFVEIAAIYNNVAYIFLYLESNEVHVDYERLLPWRDAFHKNPELDARLAERIATLRCADADAEESRQAFVDYLRDKSREPDPAVDRALERLQADAKALIAATQREQHDLLARLRIPSDPGRAAATFYKVVADTDSPATRTRLSTAWTRTRDRNVAPLVDIVDQMVRIRRRDAAEQGHDSVLARTMARCRVDEATATAYLDSYLTRALDSHARLSAQIHEVLGTTGDAMDHFGHYVRTLREGRSVPTFDLDECLAYIFLVAERTFGLTVTRAAAASPHVVTADAVLDGRACGQIKFDLWNRGAPRAANTTTGLRNRTDWAGLAQQPVAYVSCRFHRAADGSSQINFQNVHSLFHEFGHAVNHLLIRKRLPNRSGLEYLPLERLEDLSMWFEKWVYHPDLAAHLTLSAGQADGLALAQRVKMLEYRRTHVDRAVTAALDFDVHRRRDGGLRESFASLDERFAVSRFCALGDFPVYFTWPMFQANPGANFAYLWGAADSAQRFEPFLARPIGQGPAPAETRAVFASCFDIDQPTVEPDVDSVFRFYDTPGAAAPGPGGAGA